jgi:hypothetical protein
MEMLAAEVVPVLRKEFDGLRPAHVPDGPTHADLRARRLAATALEAPARG